MNVEVDIHSSGGLRTVVAIRLPQEISLGLGDSANCDILQWGQAFVTLLRWGMGLRSAKFSYANFGTL